MENDYSEVQSPQVGKYRGGGVGEIHEVSYGLSNLEIQSPRVGEHHQRGGAEGIHEVSDGLAVPANRGTSPSPRRWS